jgi:hypothetical protein
MILASHGIISSSGGVPPSTLLTNLYAVYKAESNANDSFSTINGTAQGGLTYSAGVDGNAFVFNGTNAYVSLPNNTFNSFTGDFSIGFNANIQGVEANQQCIFSTAIYNGVNWYGFYIYITGSLMYFRIGNGTPVLISLTCAWTYYVNQKVVITRKSGTRSRIYINDSLVASDTSIINPAFTTTHYPMIGAIKYDASNTTYYLTNTTKIDEVAFWSKELTATEVTEWQTNYYPF